MMQAFDFLLKNKNGTCALTFVSREKFKASVYCTYPWISQMCLNVMVEKTSMVNCDVCKV